MQCQKQPKFLEDRPTPITELWEVRIPSALWQQIRRLARQRATTYSMITRYCIFRFSSQFGWNRRKYTEDQCRQEREDYKRAPELHRHIVCFYGDDLKRVRIMALELGLTVSALIRLALRIYLRRIAMENQGRRYVGPEVLFWEAIKIYHKLHFCPTVGPATPLYLRYLPANFAPQLRWGVP